MDGWVVSERVDSPSEKLTDQLIGWFGFVD